MESKRFEPFRDTKRVEFASAYSEHEWGERMEPFTRLRDALSSGKIVFDWLDAAQLVKHAVGLVTEGQRIGMAPILLYLFAEPAMRGRTPILTNDHSAHRIEIDTFAAAVAGAAVGFAACSYREWLSGWTGEAGGHADAVLSRFNP